MSVSIQGLYGLEVVIAGFMNVPFLGEIQVVSRSLLSVEIEEVDEQLWQTQHACAVESYDSTRLSETRIPAQFVAAIPPQRIQIHMNDHEISWDPKPVYLGFDATFSIARRACCTKCSRLRSRWAAGSDRFWIYPCLEPWNFYLVQHNDIAMRGSWDGNGGRGKIEIQALAQETIGSSHMVFQSLESAYATV